MSKHTGERPNQDYVDQVEELFGDIPYSYTSDAPSLPEYIVSGGFRKLEALDPVTWITRVLLDAVYVVEEGDELISMHVVYAPAPLDPRPDQAIKLNMHSGEIGLVEPSGGASFDLREELGARLRLISHIPADFRGSGL